MNTRKDRLTPRVKGWLDQAMDRLEADRVSQKRDVIGKLADMIFNDPLRFAADIERREQAAGAPAAALGGGAVALDIKNLWLQAVQPAREVKTIEGTVEPGTSRVQEPRSHWDD